MARKKANILDPIQEVLDPSVWDGSASVSPSLQLKHKNWVIKTITDTFNAHGYDAHNWADLYVTGSICTYQYSEDSDFDVSVFVDSDIFPEWSRAEMIGIAVQFLDGSVMPGTTHPLQVFVVPEGIRPEDIYKRGLRSAYNLKNDTWVIPPDRDMARDPEVEYNHAYTYALEQADKMERLLRYEPDKAEIFWHQIHKRRRLDHKAGKGDFAPSNLVYKMLSNRGLLDQISDYTGEYIASTKVSVPVSDEWFKERFNTKDFRNPDSYLYHGTDAQHFQGIITKGIVPWDSGDTGTKYENQWMPRPGHTYVSQTPEGAYRSSVTHADQIILEIDPSLLDPQLINPDEDFLSGYRERGLCPDCGDYLVNEEGMADHSECPNGGEMANQMWSGSSSSLGEFAEAIDWGSDVPSSEAAIDWRNKFDKAPGKTLNNQGIAYNGPIPAQAIIGAWVDDSLLDPNMIPEFSEMVFGDDQNMDSFVHFDADEFDILLSMPKGPF